MERFDWTDYSVVHMRRNLHKVTTRSKVVEHWIVVVDMRFYQREEHKPETVENRINVNLNQQIL